MLTISDWGFLPSRFFDVMGVIHCEIPSGWALDLFSSRIDRIVLGNWLDPIQLLQVGVERTLVPSSRPDAEWLKACAKYHRVSENDFDELPSPKGCAYLLESRSSDGLTFLLGRRRGHNLDLILEYQEPQRSLEPTARNLLEQILSSALVPVNEHLPKIRPYSEFRSTFDGANQAIKDDSPEAAMKLFGSALDMARTALLQSLVCEERAPDLWAARQMVMCLEGIGTFVGPAGLRDAEFACFRTARLSELMPEFEEVQVLQQQLDGASLRLVEGLQRFTGELMPRASLASILSRAKWFTSVARRADGEDKLATMEFNAGIAAADFGTILLEIRKHRRDQHRSKEETAVALEFYQALYLWQLAATKMQMASAALLRAKYLTNTARILRSDEHSSFTSGMLAFSLLAQVHASMALLGDESTTDKCTELLAEARALSDDFEDDAFTAQLSLLEGRDRFKRGQLHDLTNLINKGLAAAKHAQSSMLEASLLSLRANLLNLQGNAGAAEDDAINALKAWDGSPLSTHFLALANAQYLKGDSSKAYDSASRGLAASLSDNPLGHDTINLLLGTARIVQGQEPELSVMMATAAKSVVDARWLMLETRDSRIAFDDAEQQRVVSAELFEAFIEQDRLIEALEVADGSRARVLRQLLGTPISSENEQQVRSQQFLPPPQFPSNPVAALTAAAKYVRRVAEIAMADSTYPPPPDGSRLMDLVTKTGQPALYLQPMKERLQLVLVLPGPGFIYGASPAPLEKIMHLARRVKAELGVFSVTRSDSSRSTTSESNSNITALNKTLDYLTASLLPQPLEEFITQGKMTALTLVPYRELTLIPYNLIRFKDGRFLAELLSLSIVPSLATLDIIYQRPSPSWKRALVIGDPTVDQELALEPLLAAAEEASTISRMMSSAGRGVSVELKHGPKATEDAFRTYAPGASVVHLACHADMKEPAASSCLYLASTQTQDGLLTAREISEVGLDHGLVFLSACRTGLGRPTADGVIGLGRSFIEAGASAVILALWKVADPAAAALAKHFYAYFLPSTNEKVGMPAGLALRKALLATRKDLIEKKVVDINGKALADDPMHWAPFLLMGDGLLRFGELERKGY